MPSKLIPLISCVEHWEAVLGSSDPRVQQGVAERAAQVTGALQALFTTPR